MIQRASLFIAILLASFIVMVDQSPEGLWMKGRTYETWVRCGRSSL